MAVLPGQTWWAQRAVLDDILDEGETWRRSATSFSTWCDAVWSAVLTNKDNGLIKPIRADFVGWTCPTAMCSAADGRLRLWRICRPFTH